MTAGRHTAARGGPGERLRARGEAARQQLRRAAAEGDRAARRALADLGEVPPPLRHWSERDDEDLPA